MSKRGHIDSDVAAATELRNELIAGALAQAREENLHESYRRAFEAMRSSRIYIWERPAMETFWQFWGDPGNRGRFVDEFFSHDRLIDHVDLVPGDFHIFPAPGRLFGEDLCPTEYRDPAAALIFPPTTRAIAVARCEVGGQRRLPAVIQSIEVDRNRLRPKGGMLVLERLPALPPKGTLEASRLIVHLDTRYPKIVEGLVVDQQPVSWLMRVYQLQIFLQQPFVRPMRKVSQAQTKGKGTPRPPHEIFQVQVRKPLPVPIPRYLVAPEHAVTD